MSREYQVHEFAELAGVTVKALHHYDRLDLLKPRRTDAGYRVYTLRDLERLEQIVALKFLGLPLRQIKRLLDRDVLELADSLRLQRQELEHKRGLMDRAIGALSAAEKVMQPGKPVDALALKKIIEVIGMQSMTEFMRTYYSEEAWSKWRARHDHWPSQEWLDLLGEVQSALAEDPEGEKGQALAMSWVRLRDSESGGDPAVLVGLMKTWMERRNWPPAAFQKIANFDVEGIARFMLRATNSYRKKYYCEAAWAKILAERSEEQSLAWFDLWLEVGKALDQDPASEKAQALLGRWMDLADRSISGDSDLRAGALNAWADRGSWPAEIRQETSSFNLEKISEFIEKTYSQHRKGYYSEEAWARQEQRRQTGSSAENAKAWNEMYQQVRGALEEDPGSLIAQELAQRWMDLVEKTTAGDPELKTGAIKAWQDRENWPAWKQRQIASSNSDQIVEFIGKALQWPLRRYFSQEASTRRLERGKELTSEQLNRVFQYRTELFLDVRAALGEDRAGERARALLARWKELRERESGGDPEVFAGASKAWADRRSWPRALRLQEATSYGLTLKEFEQAADFIDGAIAIQSER